MVLCAQFEASHAAVFQSAPPEGPVETSGWLVGCVNMKGRGKPFVSVELHHLEAFWRRLEALHAATSALMAAPSLLRYWYRRDRYRRYRSQISVLLSQPCNARECRTISTRPAWHLPHQLLYLPAVGIADRVPAVAVENDLPAEIIAVTSRPETLRDVLSTSEVPSRHGSAWSWYET